MGATLFIRTTRSVGLTEAGERFLSRAKPAFEELVAAGEVARGLGQRPAGLLRLSVPRAVVPILLEPLIASFCQANPEVEVEIAASEVARDLGQRPAGLLRLTVPRAVVPLILEPVLASFYQAYPEIEVEVAASEELVDLAAQGFDAGIRLGQFIAPDMVAVRLTPPFSFVVVGSPDYLRGRKRPERIDDLRDHACLRMRRSNGSIAPWRFIDGNKAIEAIVSGPLIAHDYPTLLGAAIQGLGLAQLPRPLAKVAIADGRLEALLAPFAVITPGVFLYYPDRRHVSPKLRAFIEHVKYRSADAPHDATTARKSRKLNRANSS